MKPNYIFNIYSRKLSQINKLVRYVFIFQFITSKMLSVTSSQEAAVSPVFNYLFIVLPVSVYHPVPELMSHISSFY